MPINSVKSFQISGTISLWWNTTVKCTHTHTHTHKMYTIDFVKWVIDIDNEWNYIDDIITNIGNFSSFSGFSNSEFSYCSKLAARVEPSVDVWVVDMDSKSIWNDFQSPLDFEVRSLHWTWLNYAETWPCLLYNAYLR